VRKAQGNKKRTRPDERASLVVVSTIFEPKDCNQFLIQMWQNPPRTQEQRSAVSRWSCCSVCLAPAGCA